ncbi:MAG: creatininase family protein [Usitatibacter sp.]
MHERCFGHGPRGADFLWFPQPLFRGAGGRDLFLVLALVDVTIGPLITLVIFKPGKPGLKFDLATIAVLQLAALSYGTHVLFEARPVWVVFLKDRFDLIRANQIEDTPGPERYSNSSTCGPGSTERFIGPHNPDIPLPGSTMKKVLALLFGIMSVYAQAKPLLLEELTWTELRDEIRGGTTTILIPIGGTEQNGPHMALGKHNVRARVLAQRIAGELGNALVAPVIAYVPEGAVNPPTQHMRYPGTITIPEDAFEKTLESAARSFRQHGFKDIVLLGDHGGYQKSLKRVAERLNREWKKSAARVHSIEEYYRAADRGFAKALADRGFTAAQIGTHAGLPDTALALDVDPRLVRTERLGASGNRTDTGVDGDPSRATPELGRLGTALIVDETVAAIRRVAGLR